MSSHLEEFGWRGFALPVVQTCYNALLSGLIVGLGWELRHLPLFYLAWVHYGTLAVPLLIFESIVSLTAISVMMTWGHSNAHDRTLLMILMHFRFTSNNFVLQLPASSSGSVFLKFHLISVILHWSVGAAILVLAGARQLIRQQRPIASETSPFANPKRSMTSTCSLMGILSSS